jgi:myosin-1
VSINPYKTLDLYNKEITKKYAGKYLYENPPHPFSLADSAYRNMLKEKKNQAIIVSGESGAGKTEASKVILRYLADVTPTSKHDDMAKIKDQLLDSNPILEAFGNAKTLRNDNSSRFGKYMQTVFSLAGFPVGGLITVYLLEKSRVVTRAVDERSFHIFYNLLAGADDGLLSSLKLVRDASTYRYLSLSGCYSVDTINDKSDFSAVIAALKTLQFPDEVVSQVWRLVAGILHLGQISFSEGEAAQVGEDSAKVDNEDELATTAELFGVEVDSLRKSLLNRTVEAKGQVMVRPLDPQTAAYARDALAKAVYERLFLYVVRQINLTIENKTVSEADQVRIGLLDIYGFEVFEVNSLEQLFINYTNEKLQQVFIERTLKQEQEEYEREGIEWTPVEYFNNKVICDLIEAKQQSLIALLDEACLMNKTDELFLKNLGESFTSHDHFEDFDKNKDQTLDRMSFRLKHYAGDVVYSVDGFLDKNEDQLFRDLITTMGASSQSLLKDMFPPPEDTKKRPESAGSQFRRSVNELITLLMSCDPHYVRCVKPNSAKAANTVDEELIRHQIRYLGLLENVRVRRAGFAYRSEYARFVGRYKMLGDKSWPNYGDGTDMQGATKYLVNEVTGVPDELYRLGKTKVFLKDPKTLFSLEDARQAALPALVARLQAQWRGVKPRDHFIKNRAAIYVQRHLRAWQARELYKRNIAAVQVQKHVRAKAARQDYARLKATFVIQRYARMWKEKTHYEEVKDKWAKEKAGKYLHGLFYRVMARRYFVDKVYKKFKDARNDPKLGIDFHWPKPSPSLANSQKHLRAIFETWRAHTLIKRVPASDRPELDDKMAAYDMFHNVRPWAPGHRYNKTNYLALDDAARAGKIPSDVKFAFDANKVNTSSKLDPRVIAVSGDGKQLLKFDAKSMKPKDTQELSALTEVVVSRHADSTVILKFSDPEKDLMLFMTPSDDRLNHFVYWLQKHCGATDGLTKPKVTFVAANGTADAANARPKPTTVSVTFAKDTLEVAPGTEVDPWPKARFTKGAKNANTVHYPEKHPKLAYPGDFEPMKRSKSYMKRSKSSKRKKKTKE